LVKGPSTVFLLDASRRNSGCVIEECAFPESSKRGHFLPILQRSKLPATRLITLAALVLVFNAAARSQTISLPRDDKEVWTEYQLAVPIDDKTDFVALGVLRFGRNVSRPVNERIGAGVSRKIGKYLTVFPFYLHVAAQPTSISHSTEERITLEAAVKFPLGPFKLIDRNRVEFHFHSRLSWFTQYRNRPQITHPMRIGKVEFEGFIADEVFYDSIASAWIRNRFYVGISKKVNAHFTFEAFYVRQNDSHSHPGDINALGTVLKFRL
jgi:uncharacterized protein DUF2490